MAKENIILLHGALGSKIQLQELKQLLSSHFNVFDLNFEGHGDRPSVKEFSMDLFVDNVQEKLAEFGIKQTHIFGYSMGGYVGLHLATKRPELIKRIMTLGAKFNWSVDIAKQEIRKLNPEKIEEKVPAFAKHLKELHIANDWKSVVRKTASLMEDLGSGKKLSLAKLKKIKHEVFIGIGEFDKMVTLDESKQTADLLPNGKLLLMKGVKHPIESISKKLLAETIIKSII